MKLKVEKQKIEIIPEKKLDYVFLQGISWLMENTDILFSKENLNMDTTICLEVKRGNMSFHYKWTIEGRNISEREF